jgi:transcriptional regulator with XRE-family HTH domain
MPETPLRKATAEAICELREGKGLTRRELAERSGLSADWIRRLESGKHESTWETLKAVAQGLGVSLAEFSQEVERMEREVR